MILRLLVSKTEDINFLVVCLRNLTSFNSIMESGTKCRFTINLNLRPLIRWGKNGILSELIFMEVKVQGLTDKVQG